MVWTVTTRCTTDMVPTIKKKKSSAVEKLCYPSPPHICVILQFIHKETNRHICCCCYEKMHLSELGVCKSVVILQQCVGNVSRVTKE